MSQFNEPDDDAARLDWAQRQLLGGTVEQLLAIQDVQGIERGFLNGLDMRLNVLKQMPTQGDIEQLKILAWKHRRQLPRHSAPKLNPEDPVVREMEKRA